MKTIYTLSDIKMFRKNGIISKALAKHLERKITALNQVLEPYTALEDFSLEIHGPFSLLEKGDNDLTYIGLPEDWSEISPEWVSRLEISGETWYILYIMPDNDYIEQVFLPVTAMSERILQWVQEIPAEIENDDDEIKLPQPF